jgi:hypothetical protein
MGLFDALFDAPLEILTLPGAVVKDMIDGEPTELKAKAQRILDDLDD